MFQATPFSQNYTDPARSSTTLGRWHRGYHGFEPNLTNKLGVSCNLSCSPSPAVRFRTGDPVTRCKYIPVSSASPSLARKVTVPLVPENEVYVCGHIGRFKQVSSHRIAPTPLWSRRWHCCQLVRRGDLALVHGCTCSTTLSCWRSGYYGF